MKRSAMVKEKIMMGLVCLLVLGVVLAARAEAGDLYVPGSYTNIQLAVNAASPGDTIPKKLVCQKF